jgi:prepilin peptidase CpaA
MDIMEVPLQGAAVVAAAAILTVAAYCDVRSRRIPNALAVAVAGLGLVRLLLTGDPVAALWTLAAAAAVLFIGFLFFAFRLVGGGDAKLLAAAALLVGAHDLPAFLLLMSLLGGVVGLAVAARQHLRSLLMSAALMLLAHERLGGWCARRPRLASLLAATGGSDAGAYVSVPYGLAIAAAGVVIVFLQISSQR